MIQKRKSKEQGKFKKKRTVNIKISTKGSENKVKDVPQKVIQKDIRDGDGQH